MVYVLTTGTVYSERKLFVVYVLTTGTVYSERKLFVELERSTLERQLSVVYVLTTGTVFVETRSAHYRDTEGEQSQPFGNGNKPACNERNRQSASALRPSSTAGPSRAAIATRKNVAE